MALLINDPYGGGENLMDQGQSRITASATSGASAKGVVAQYNDAMSNAAKLTQALSSLTGTISSQEQKNQALTDQAYRLTENENVNALRKGNDTGGITGALRSVFGGNKPSPSAFMAVAASQGRKVVTEGIETHKLWKDFQDQASKLIVDNPAEYKKQYEATIEAIRADLLQRNKNFADSPYRSIFEAQLNEAVKEIKSKQNIDAAKTQIQAMRKAQLEKANADFVSRSKEVNFFDLFGRTTGSSGTNLPYEAAQVARLESGFDGTRPHRSSDGSPVTAKGLFGINDARYATIIASMKRDGLDVSQLTDRNSDAVNMKLFQYEWQQISETAAKDLGRPATTAEKYLYWQLPSIAGGILKAKPDTPIKDIVADRYIKANQSIYGDGNISVKQVLNNINDKMKSGSVTYGQLRPVASLSDNYITADTWDNASTKWGYKWTELNPRKMKGEDATLRIHAGVVQALDQLSSALGRKIPVYSSHRTHEYNQTLKGSAKRVYDAQGNIVKRGSAHIEGAAMDVGITNPDEQRRAIRMLGAMGVKSIGVYGSHLHFDIRGSGTWSRSGGKIPVDEIKTLLKEGQELASKGGFYRVQGFNGSPLTSREIAIKKYSETAGVPLAVAKDNVNKLTVTQADTAVAAGDFNNAREVLSVQLADPNLSATEKLNFQKKLTEVDAKENQRFNVEKATIARQNSQATDAYHSQVQAEQNEGKPLTAPDRKKWSADVAGQNAYENAQKFYELNPTASFADRRKRLDTLSQSITADRPAFLRLIGLDPDSTPTPAQVRDALIATQRDYLKHTDVAKLQEAYSNEILAAPFTERVANAAVKSSVGTLSNLRKEATLAVPQETFTNASDKNLAAQDEVRLQQAIDAHFKTTYGSLYRAKQEALGLTPTQYLNGADEATVRKEALSDTQKFTQAESVQLRRKWIDRTAEGVGKEVIRSNSFLEMRKQGLLNLDMLRVLKTGSGKLLFGAYTAEQHAQYVGVGAQSVAEAIASRMTKEAAANNPKGIVDKDTSDKIRAAAIKGAKEYIDSTNKPFAPILKRDAQTKEIVRDKNGNPVYETPTAKAILARLSVIRDPALVLTAQYNKFVKKQLHGLDRQIINTYMQSATGFFKRGDYIVTNQDGSPQAVQDDSGDFIYTIMRGGKPINFSMGQFMKEQAEQPDLTELVTPEQAGIKQTKPETSPVNRDGSVNPDAYRKPTDVPQRRTKLDDIAEGISTGIASFFRNNVGKVTPTEQQQKFYTYFDEQKKTNPQLRNFDTFTPDEQNRIYTQMWEQFSKQK